MTVRTYWAWETTATLRLLGGARGTGAPTGGGEGRGHIASPRAQLVTVCRSSPKLVVNSDVIHFSVLMLFVGNRKLYIRPIKHSQQQATKEGSPLSNDPQR